ncbi:permease prefix domain 1-containing protein [Microbacterium rhizosphaerae]|uniref:Permease prefix domain 1-containing protein n=1 Tax=Microbacterium rhizosphaerae TaxID=1678237 RepID=A0ABZ0SIW4_9MICO|nr:permease prefix domain 1-containing protein [Microbacterium rhizosphaerae]WPR89003.1 permease prefix domain 1-containing protein [Microbacterium rhizosphaerae]
MGVEERIVEWRGFVARREAIGADVDELEAHLRDQIDVLVASGLSEDEAFLIAVSRMGKLDELSQEFAREHSDRLWKQLVVGSAEPMRRTTGLWLALAFAVGGAVLVKVPSLLGMPMPEITRNAAVLLLPALAAYFLVCRRASPATIIAVAVPFAAAAVLLNVYPFAPGGVTAVLAAVHAAVALWIVTGIAYARGEWRSERARMDFIRFTGEWVVYYALIALGGGVLVALTMGVFSAVGVDATAFVGNWLIPCGAAGAIVIAAWLVEAKQAVIENIAPVLTKVFTPLFTLLLLALIVAAVVQAVSTGGFVDAQREVLIIFDLVLVVVVGLLLYALSARGADLRPGWFDRLQVLLVAAAIIVDLLVLIAMLGRIGAFGASANKIASLGLNVILLVNLAGSLWLQLGFVRGRSGIGRLERWQTGFLPVYLAWATIVVVVFPPVFGFA